MPSGVYIRTKPGFWKNKKRGPMSQMHKDKISYGLTGHCVSEESKEKSKDKRRMLRVRREALNKGYIRERNRLYTLKHKKRIKQWHVDYKEERKIWFKGYRERHNILMKKRLHKLGISKEYNDGRSETKEYKALMRHRRRTWEKGGGKLTIKTIQMVYEDNIKKFETLTCVYCINPVPFGNDTLEHKQPLSREGTNEYNNLAIACHKCNSSKGNRTEEEYRKEL